MPKKFKQREIAPDSKYDNVIVGKFINQLMKGGKKTTAQRVAYNAFDLIKKRSKKEPIEVFEKALKIVGPSVEVRPRRVGGATYQVPIEVKDKRRMGLAMRWLINASQAKKGKAMDERLADEILAAAKNEGEAVKKKINVEKMAAANKAFAYLAKRAK